MHNALSFLLLAAIVAIGWRLSRRNGQLARKTTWILGAVLTTLFVGLAASGGLHGVETGATVHRWLGHLLLIAVWVFVPFAVGVVLHERFPKRLVLGVFELIALLVLVGVTLVASFSGFLGPFNEDQTTEETRNRFIVLHLVALPAILVSLLGAWLWRFRQGGIAKAQQSHPPEPPSGSVAT